MASVGAGQPVYWGALSGIVGAPPQPRADPDVFCRLHAGVGALVFSHCRLGKPAAPKRITDVATRELCGLWFSIDLSGTPCRARYMKLFNLQLTRASYLNEL